jgi:hypothetical protein
MTDNEIIERNVKILDISREEATQMLEDDKRIDKGEKLFTLTPEQEKASKKARQADRKKRTTVYKFDTSKRKKPENKGKQTIITALKEAVEGLGADSVNVTNNEREFFFEMDGTKYKVVLSMPRK